MLYKVSLAFYCLFVIDKNTTSKKELIFKIISILVPNVLILIMFLFPEYPSFFFVSFTLFTLITFILIFTLSCNNKITKRLCLEGFFCLTFGLFLWILENTFCEHIEFLKFHSFWHFFAVKQYVTS
jgi:hypothetical protein